MLDWCGINDCLHKLIAVERSIEDWRMKGECIRDRIARCRVIKRGLSRIDYDNP